MENNELLSSKKLENHEKSTETMEEAENSDSILENKENNKDKNNEMLLIDFNSEEQIVSTKDLTEELEKLKQQLIEERNESISKINLLNQKDKEKKQEMKSLFNNMIININKLKKHDKNLLLSTRLLSKYKNNKNEEEIKKDIKLKEAQIKLYTKWNANEGENYKKLEHNLEIEKNKENKLNEILLKLKLDITNIKEEINKLKIIVKIHDACKNNNILLLEKYHIIHTDYEYELKRSKQLAKIYINEKDEEDAVIEEEYDRLEEEEKAKKDAKNIFPKIKKIRFRGENMQRLEEKIIKINRIGQTKINNIENKTKLYKKLDNIYKDKTHYIKKANSYIRKKREINIDYNDHYLFSENDAKIVNKIIPEKMLFNYKNKYNEIIKYKKDIKRNFNNECNTIKNESALIFNKFERNMIDSKTVKLNELKLILKSQKLSSKIYNAKLKIIEIKEQLKKINNKLLDKENESKRINLFYKNFSSI